MATDKDLKSRPDFFSQKKQDLDKKLDTFNKDMNVPANQDQEESGNDLAWKLVVWRR